MRVQTTENVYTSIMSPHVSQATNISGVGRFQNIGGGGGDGGTHRHVHICASGNLKCEEHLPFLPFLLPTPVIIILT